MICGKSFEDELDMVYAAQENEQGEYALRDYLQPLVERIAVAYGDYRLGHAELVWAGWDHFHRAMEMYVRRVEDMEDGVQEKYKFSTYFSWFIRQDVLTYAMQNT